MTTNLNSAFVDKYATLRREQNGEGPSEKEISALELTISHFFGSPVPAQLSIQKTSEGQIDRDVLRTALESRWGSESKYMNVQVSRIINLIKKWSGKNGAYESDAVMIHQNISTELKERLHGDFHDESNIFRAMSVLTKMDSGRRGKFGYQSFLNLEAYLQARQLI